VRREQEIRVTQTRCSNLDEKLPAHGVGDIDVLELVDKFASPPA
jgi:hypothetical protein